eukprot:Phypoly_transcript_20599.p1 GENE.Phypoly_transcript_20599~~Phypoly_transcript_20599.p1  ORF type:complete len:200 (+),score=22.01 Phypoly_transcript_20599:58-657(+)
MIDLLNLVKWDHPDLLWAAAVIIFNPTWWNIVARSEHKTRFLTKIFGGPYSGCYFLALCIFALGIYRDKMFDKAIESQPQSPLLDNNAVLLLSLALYALGGIFVLSSMWKLGITGTYLGDYFGILMEKRVTGFPFNVLNNPMYNGSTMLFLAHALWKKSVAGIALTGLVFVVYWIALMFEGPFTSMIYAQKNKKSQKKK